MTSRSRPGTCERTGAARGGTVYKDVGVDPRGGIDVAPAGASPVVTRTASFALDAVDEAAVVEMIVGRTAPLVAGEPHLIVTPNMHHLAILQEEGPLAEAYERASLRLADGWPVVTLGTSLGFPLTGRTTGSGIVTRLATTDGSGKRLFVIGGSTQAAHERALARFATAGWDVQGHQAPREWIDFETNLSALFAEVREHSPDVALIGIGVPNQEDLALLLIDGSRLPAVYLGVGAGIDFIAGEVKRAPRWMQRARLEFLHRILLEPGRLLKRYAADLLPFVAVVRQSHREMRRSRARRAAREHG